MRVLPQSTSRFLADGEFRRQPGGAKQLLVALVFLAALSGVCVGAAAKPDAGIHTEQGLHKLSLNTLSGTVHVYLPDDMAAGDTISGTIMLQPSGATETERARNKSTLSGTVVDFDGEKVAASESRFTIRAAIARDALPIVFAPAKGSRAFARTKVEVPLASQAAAESGIARAVTIPGGFDWPAAILQGSPTTIPGSFDGDCANTRMLIGGAEATVLAESPRRAVFQSPTSTPGPADIEVSEGGTVASGTTRSVQVGLSAPKTDLRRGESVTVSVDVAGLQELAHPLPVQLRTTGSANMEGGNLQRIQIAPGDPDPAGNFHAVRTITGVAPGNFDIRVDLVWAQPAPHWLEGRIVHVEGAPGGQPGRWRVPVTEPGDRSKRGIYFDGEKPPALRYCNWIEIKDAEERDGVDFVIDYDRTTDPKEEAKPGKGGDTKPGNGAAPVAPPAPGGSGGETTEPPPCENGTVRNVVPVEKKITLLDGKQEMFLHAGTDKDRAAAAGEEFAGFLKKVAELGGEAIEHLPEGTGAGGTAAGLLLKYLEGGGAIMEGVVKGKLRLAGAMEFTAVMDVGLRDVVATCTSMDVCVNGAWVPSKKFKQTETKRREQFVKKAKKGDDEWEAISDSSGRIDPAKAAKWANDFFKEQANILKGNGDDLQKFKDACK